MDIEEPLTQLELLDGDTSTCSDKDREALIKLCSTLYRHIMDDQDLQQVVMNKQFQFLAPEMLSRRFFVNFLL